MYNPKITVVDAIMGIVKPRLCIHLIPSRDNSRLFWGSPSFLCISPRIVDYQEVHKRGAMRTRASP